MKVLTAEQMNRVDQWTIEAGVPGMILMENAGHRVVERMEHAFAPLADQRVVVLCGKGNNGGDGLVIARLLHARFPAALAGVVLACEPDALRGDAAAAFRMLRAAGGGVSRSILPSMRFATVVVDALLGTGMRGPAAGEALELIREINDGFPLARVVAVDLPSGMNADEGTTEGEYARADVTVTFTAPKPAHVLAPNANQLGTLHIDPIGTDPALLARPEFDLELITPVPGRPLFRPRPRDGHKGTFGHVLLVAGSVGKSGAAALAGMAALRAGAGLVTVAAPAEVLSAISAFAPELMTEAYEDARDLLRLADGKTVAAIGPGLGASTQLRQAARGFLAGCALPAVVDADALNAIAGAGEFESPAEAVRVFTPHPGEMARLAGTTTAAVAAARIEMARAYARRMGVYLVLKGQRTLIAEPDGMVAVNPTGTPAMGTAGAGDVLTGLIAGLWAQHPHATRATVRAAVYLHGLAGELGAAEMGEQALAATDILRYWPAAISRTSARASS